MVQKKKTRKKKKPVKQEMSINQVNNAFEAILYFFKFILIQHFWKTIIFGLLISFILVGFKCSTKWFSLEKQPMKKLPSVMSEKDK